MEENWRDLFLLTAVEEQFQLNSKELLSRCDNSELYRIDLEKFEDICNEFQRMKIDANELICLKSFVLFQPSFKNLFHDLSTINYLHHQAQLLLNTYIQKQYPFDEHRFFKYFTLISSFHSISSSTIEEIFFRKTIGEQTHMEQLVKDMYQMAVH